MSLALPPNRLFGEPSALRVGRPLISPGQVFRAALLGTCLLAGWLLLSGPSHAFPRDAGGFSAFRASSSMPAPVRLPTSRPVAAG